MIKHAIAMLLTLAIYNLAPVPYVFSFAIASTWSFTYIYAIYRLNFSCSIPLIVIESAGIITMLITCILEFLSSESQWFSSNYERIMSICYVAEIVVIIIGAARDEYRRLKSVHLRWLDIFNDRVSIFGSFRNSGLNT